MKGLACERSEKPLGESAQTIVGTELKPLWKKKSETKGPGVRGHTRRFQVPCVKDLGCSLKSKRKPVRLAVQLKT